MQDYDKLGKMSPVDKEIPEVKHSKPLLKRWQFWVLWILGIAVLRFIFMMVLEIK